MTIEDNGPPDGPPDIDGYTAIHIFDDPTPNAILNERIVRRVLAAAEKYTDLTPQERSDLSDLVIVIGRKICSVYSHGFPFLRL